MSKLLHDLRYALRGLRRSPGFTLAAAVTLAVGIGASAAVFAVLYSVVLSPLRYRDPQELVRVDSPVPGVGAGAAWNLSQAGYFYFREHNRTLDELGVFSTGRHNLSREQGAELVTTAFVSASLIDVLRARPLLGRLIQPSDDRPGAPDVVVLDHALWQQEYGGDSTIVGRTISLDGNAVEVIGVMEAGFDLPDQSVDLWLPLGLNPAARPVNSHWLQAIGRLKTGVRPDEAGRDLEGMTRRFTELFPQAYSPAFMRESGFRTRVTPLRTFVIGNIADVLWMLYGGVGLVLLIALANVANLLLVRTESRQRDLAIQTALGATRWHLVRRWLAEGIVLGTIAGAAGLVLAELAVDLLIALSPAALPRLRDISVGSFTVGYVVLTALVLGLTLGLWPLVQVRFGAFRGGTEGLLRSRAGRTVRPLLVGGEIAVALVLLAGAGLMFRSMIRLRAVDPGLDPAGVLTVDLTRPGSRYGGDYAPFEQFYRQLITRVEALPGVRSAGAGQGVPLRGLRGCAAVFVEAHPLGSDEQPPCVSSPLVSPGYFAALGIPLRGEQPGWSDVEAHAAGVVVTPALARRLWPGEDPIGKGIRPNGWARPFYRVVGVTGELRADGLDRPATEAVFYPVVPRDSAPLWAPPGAVTLVVRANTDHPEVLLGGIRRIVTDLDPTVALGTAQTMEQVVSRSVARRSFVMLLLAIAASVALVLSMVGVYGVVAYVVERRRGEVSLRMALGAQAEQVSALMVRDALRVALLGAAVGLALALLTGRALRSLLFEVSPVDPVTLGGATVLLTAIAALASYLPARRAAQIAPMEALRHE